MTFIVLEGGEGSGKSTQSQRLVSWLQARGVDVVATFEPGDTKMGRAVRDILLHGDAPLGPHTELLLMLADRAQHIAEVIQPALARGAVVVCDRFTPSTLAYQGAGREIGVDAVESLAQFVASDVEPSLVIVLDVPDAVAETRVAATRDRVERAGAAFHARVRAAYRELAPGRGWVVVDGTGSVGAVAARVQDAVAAVLP